MYGGCSSVALQELLEIDTDSKSIYKRSFL